MLVDANGLLYCIQKDTFRYLGSVLQKDGDIDEDVRHTLMKMLGIEFQLAG